MILVRNNFWLGLFNLRSVSYVRFMVVGFLGFRQDFKDMLGAYQTPFLTQISNFPKHIFNV